MQVVGQSSRSAFRDVPPITLWNTVYLDRAVKALQSPRPPDESPLSHLSPLSWEHIHLTGDLPFMFDWPEQRKTSPIMMSLSVGGCRSRPDL
jgi:hypothetical protein